MALSACLLIAGCRLGNEIRRDRMEPLSTDTTKTPGVEPPSRSEVTGDGPSRQRDGLRDFGRDDPDKIRAEPAFVQLTGIESAAADSATQPTDSETGSTETPEEQPVSFRNDLTHTWSQLRDDARGVVNWNNAAILGGALGAALVLRADVDGDVRRDTARHPARWGNGTEFLEKFGDPVYQVPVLAGLYAISLKQQNPELHSLSGSLLSAYAISSVSTVAIKAIANTDRPSGRFNNGHYGFPSFHTSSAFSIAAVLDEYYGPRAGLPAYALAGLVGWSRIDQRDHDLSDVLFGAAIGFVVGKSVAGRKLRGDSRVRLRPYTHPTESANGLMLDIAY